MAALRCFWCIVDWQKGASHQVQEAVTVYAGKACCFIHVNTMRGQLADYGGDLEEALR